MLANKSSNNYEYEASRVLNVLINKGYSKIIYSSSAIVYGDNSLLPRKETDPVIAMDTYTRIKLKNEYSILSKADLVLRFSNVYGPSMSPNNVLSSILRQLTSGELIRLNNLSSIRDFIWVEDAASAILNLIESPIQGLFNIGSGVGTSISEIVQTILKASGQSNRKIVSETIYPKESCIVLDISKILNQTKWSPTLSISQGLNRLININ